MLEIQFRDSARKELLRIALKDRGIELRLLAGTIKGYVDLPRDLYNREGIFKQDELLKYVESLFPTEVLNEEQQEIMETAKRQIRSPEKVGEDQKDSVVSEVRTEAPLAARRRQMKKRDDPST